jgi:hypothetical protein
MFWQHLKWLNTAHTHSEKLSQHTTGKINQTQEHTFCAANAAGIDGKSITTQRKTKKSHSRQDINGYRPMTFISSSLILALEPKLQKSSR